MRRLASGLIVLALLAQSCGIFETRAPETPDTGNNFIWTPASSTTLLLQNFEGTLEGIDGTNHERAFIHDDDSIMTSGGATYTFQPRAGLDQASLTTFATWDVASEATYLNKLRTSLDNNARLTLVLTNPETSYLDASSARYKADYSLLVPVDQSSPIPSSVSGSLIFDLKLVRTAQGTNEWRIVTWSDLLPLSGVGPTWSDLKAKLVL